jgi:hypothetical protein
MSVAPKNNHRNVIHLFIINFMLSFLLFLCGCCDVNGGYKLILKMEAEYTSEKTATTSMTTWRNPRTELKSDSLILLVSSNYTEKDTLQIAELLTVCESLQSSTRIVHDEVAIARFQILSNSSFINYNIIRRHIINVAKQNTGQISDGKILNRIRF